MNDYRAMIRNVFERWNEGDAKELFETMIQNAFPTFSFHGLALTECKKEDYVLLGKSSHHEFDITRSILDGSSVWLVRCHRVSMGKTPDRHVYLDFMTLGFVQYSEIK